MTCNVYEAMKTRAIYGVHVPIAWFISLTMKGDVS